VHGIHVDAGRAGPRRQANQIPADSRAQIGDSVESRESRRVRRRHALRRRLFESGLGEQHLAGACELRSRAKAESRLCNRRSDEIRRMHSAQFGDEPNLVFTLERLTRQLRE
jgi:hypothetical protein